MRPERKILCLTKDLKLELRKLADPDNSFRNDERSDTGHMEKGLVFFGSAWDKMDYLQQPFQHVLVISLIPS